MDLQARSCIDPEPPRRRPAPGAPFPSQLGSLPPCVIPAILPPDSSDLLLEPNVFDRIPCGSSPPAACPASLVFVCAPVDLVPPRQVPPLRPASL